MQDAIYAVANAPDGSSPGLWFYSADGRYTHIPSIAQRDLIASTWGVPEKPLSYAAHQLLLARTAPATLTLTDAQAAVIAQQIGAKVAVPTTITLSATGKLS